MNLYGEAGDGEEAEVYLKAHVETGMDGEVTLERRSSNIYQALSPI